MKAILATYSKVIERRITSASVPLNDTDSDVLIYYRLHFCWFVPKQHPVEKHNLFYQKYKNEKIITHLQRIFFFPLASPEMKQGFY